MIIPGKNIKSKMLGQIIGIFAMVWMFVSSKIQMLNLKPKRMVLWGGDSGRWLDHEGRVLIGRVSDFIKETQKKFFRPFRHVRLRQDGQPFINQETDSHQTEPDHADILILDFQLPERWEINY